jgi:heme exporter protein A
LENLTYNLHRTDLDQDHSVFEEFQLKQSMNSPVANLSNGQSRKAALSFIIMSGKSLWVFDEPYANLDSQSIVYLNQRIAAHLSDNGMVITSTNREEAVPTTNLEITMS